MSTGPKVAAEEFHVEYVPFGEKNTIRLTESMVRQYLEVRTKSGKAATPADVRTFLEMCAAQGLNPWVRDAFLVGYDVGEGANFSLITSHQALLKRAEFSPQFNGMESGVIVTYAENPKDAADDNTQLREGDFVFDSEILLGAWAAVYRRDRDKPFRDRLHISVFNTTKSRWSKDPAGMIVKCAEASVFRKAFPSSLAGLYCQEEMEAVHSGMIENKSIAITDGRSEQNRIVIPTTKEEPVRVERTESRDGSGEVRDERPEVRDERQELEDAVQRRQPTEDVWPEPIGKLIQSARRATTEMGLLSVKQGWLSIKAGYQEDMVAEVDKFLERRSQEVKPLGKK